MCENCPSEATLKWLRKALSLKGPSGWAGGGMTLKGHAWGPKMAAKPPSKSG